MNYKIYIILNDDSEKDFEVLNLEPLSIPELVCIAFKGFEFLFKDLDKMKLIKTIIQDFHKEIFRLNFP